MPDATTSQPVPASGFALVQQAGGKVVPSKLSVHGYVVIALLHSVPLPLKSMVMLPPLVAITTVSLQGPATVGLYENVNVELAPEARFTLAGTNVQVIGALSPVIPLHVNVPTPPFVNVNVPEVSEELRFTLPAFHVKGLQ